ncbi:MAG: NifB/NifX family molybdenum-iron cluster-binding protein [Desulfonauticus sp.]|nr:NifB/NifX family molybdenum-iron cluster-binding protein [Desulfonauticus sp.]
MKIAIPTSGKDLSAPFEQRFGRAPQFIIYDTDTKEFKVINNEQNLTAMQGAGVQTAQNIAKEGVEAVLTANCGPKAFQVLSKTGIKVYTVNVNTVQEAIDKFLQNQVSLLDNANVEGHW